MENNESTNGKKINILQLMSWLSAATSQNSSFLMKPNDMKMLYLLFLWEYVSKHHPKNLTEPVKIEDDKMIALPEAEVINLVQLLFNKTFYNYFNTTFNM